MEGNQGEVPNIEESDYSIKEGLHKDSDENNDISKPRVDANECDPIIRQKLTGKKIRNEPQWEVFIKAKCYCDYSNVKLACHGFKTVEPLDSIQVSSLTTIKMFALLSMIYIQTMAYQQHLLTLGVNPIISQQFLLILLVPEMT
ncbi:hypothetical protein POM88_043768 [Heracleum sosnowskyi]|uniref:Uncharacterized protein n=1 Tax=Heracleum sosnowskyi TaxID=360622 RepID=A0AAD8H3Z8_9APIA|nr:hypothetical protein POM88_043768 [Heracleum sosnowskyi]